MSMDIMVRNMMSVQHRSSRENRAATGALRRSDSTHLDESTTGSTSSWASGHRPLAAVHGALGARLLSRFEELQWIKRRAGTRALTITETGARDLGPSLGLDVTDVLAAQEL